MKIRPLHDWVVVKPSEANDRTAGGLYIPESAKSKPHEGEVLAVGKGRWKEKEESKKARSREKKDKTDKTFVETILKPGQKIAYDQWAGRKVEVEGEELVMVREEDVLGTYD